MTEPIAFFDPHKGFYWAKPTKINAPVTVDVEPLSLYAQRTWVGLDEEDYIKALELCDFDKDAAFEFFETKLKDLNNG
jgi:hypothetical protein